MANRLADETSPYLLQHKDNPVDWRPWSEEALSEARERDVPLLESIGYSACHWCHVMERESFEDADIAVHGIVLAGGGSLLSGFAELVQVETGMPVSLADGPLSCVVRGAGEALAEFGATSRAAKRRSQLGLRPTRMAGSAAGR